VSICTTGFLESSGCRTRPLKTGGYQPRLTRNGYKWEMPASSELMVQIIWKKGVYGVENPLPRIFFDGETHKGSQRDIYIYTYIYIWIYIYIHNIVNRHTDCESDWHMKSGGTLSTRGRGDKGTHIHIHSLKKALIYIYTL